MSLRLEIHIFLTEKNHLLADKFNDESWVAKLAFLSDIFERLNELNNEMQGKNRTMVDIGEKIISFKQKLALWRKKLSQGKIAIFSLLSEFLEDSRKVTLNDLKLLFQECLDKLQLELDIYQKM